ncbi:hypothetical protein H0H87_005463 [Tephrocybe sp. NHM501043]|nr:hypothetical protein H0H87_005463 [Tephrocybe sp. NHM501043]
MGRIAVSDSMPDLNGLCIDGGRLKLLESLGSGAYGKVYRALDVLSPPNKPVHYAVKCLLRPDKGSHQEQFQAREIKLHKLVCDHPNIVTLHRVIYDEAYIYVVLELCPGGDLFAAITEAQVFHNKVQLVKNSFVQLIDAVDHCHKKSVFHRDIKPENVLCSANGTDIRLADFGLSTQDFVTTDFGCGSSYYMSPECIGKELSVGHYSTRFSDIWSLGVILTNMISGRNPWRYATAEDECFSAYMRDKDFLRQVLPISRGANAILKRIFRINPMSRIKLRDLRQEVLNVDTFFMTEEELACANSTIRKAAQSYSEGKHREAQAAVAQITRVFESTDEPDSSVSSDEVYVFDSPPANSIPPSPSSSVPPTAFLTVPGHNVDSNSASSSARTSNSTNSGSDSDGPITPTTHAVNPAIEVPDLPEGETLDQTAIFAASQPANPPKSKSVVEIKVKKATNRKRLFHLAFKQFKGHASGNKRT